MSSKESKITESTLEINQLKNIKKDSDKEFNEKVKHSINLAVDHIISKLDYEDVQKIAKIKDQYFLYTIYESDKDATEDKHGNQIKFGDYYLKTILIKNKEKFLNELKSRFKAPFEFGYFKDKKLKNTYRIYMSWRDC